MVNELAEKTREYHQKHCSVAVAARVAWLVTA